MRTYVPGLPTDAASADWGLRRAVRHAFPAPAALADDAEHSARLRVYLADLLEPYGTDLDLDALGRGGQSYGEMAEELIRQAVPEGESVDLLVLAYSVPDIAPGRATTTYLSHVCPGRPMAFAVSDQGNAAAFTALRLIREYARRGDGQRALLLVVEQSSLPYDTGEPVALPTGNWGVALLFGPQAPGEWLVGIGPVDTRQGLAESWQPERFGREVTAILGASLAERGGAKQARVADAGRPGTGVWWELAGELAERPSEARRLVLADYEPGLRYLSTADLTVVGAPVCLDDYRGRARARLDDQVWDFVEGGAEAERTVAANRNAFDRVTLRPRVLVDVSHADTRTDLLGAGLATPLGIAPTAYHRLFHPDGEVATARGAAVGGGVGGALYLVSMFASRTLEDIAAAATAPLWLQVYWLRRRELLAGLIGRAAAAGYGAIVLTVDAPRLGRRRRDARNGFAMPADVVAVNLDGPLMASAHRATAGRSALAVHTAEAVDPSVTWDDLAWLRARSGLPLVLKGILCAEDALLAVEHGADAIVVSNHGGRQLDGAPASLDALAEVADAIGPTGCPVLFDGGVRGGTDAFAALALGARAVLLGRPVLWGLASDGAAGVAGVLDLATEELAHTMALTGRPGLASVDGSAVALRPRA